MVLFFNFRTDPSASASSIGEAAFYGCLNLTSFYFKGSAPNVVSDVFKDTGNVIVYYLPCSTGWGPTFGGRPARVWQGDK